MVLELLLNSLGGGYKGVRRIITNRFLRLFIPVLLANGLCLVMMKMGYITAVSVSETTGSSWLRGVYSFEADWRSWLFDSYYRVMFCGDSVYNSAFWTIAYSLYGSFLVALIVVIWGGIRERWIIYAITCVVLWSMGTQGTINCNYFVAFIIGGMIADIKIHFQLKLKKIYGILLLVISCLLADYPIGVAPTNMYRFLDIGNRAAFLWHILGAGLMIFTIINFEESGRILGSRGMQFLGKISFSVYLIHMQVLGSFSTFLFQKMFESGISYSVSFTGTVALSLVLIVGIGWAVYEIIERRINKILNYMYFRVFQSERTVKN